MSGFDQFLQTLMQRFGQHPELFQALLQQAGVQPGNLEAMPRIGDAGMSRMMQRQLGQWRMGGAAPIAPQPPTNVNHYLPYPEAGMAQPTAPQVGQGPAPYQPGVMPYPVPQPGQGPQGPYGGQQAPQQNRTMLQGGANTSQYFQPAKPPKPGGTAITYNIHYSPSGKNR